jgi:hypothetical protein
MIIGLFVLVSASFWTAGYVSTRSLWQARLLLPAVIPFGIPAALGMMAVSDLDAKGFRLSFIIMSLSAVSIFANLLDSSLSIIARNPLAVAAGIVTREEYMTNYQPGYASAIFMTSQIPRDSKIYSLFEPRSYNIPRSVQPDTILDNFSHDAYLYRNPRSIVRAWKREGYTHVLLNLRGAQLKLSNDVERITLDETIQLIELVSTSPDGSYALYEIPSS